MLQYLNIITAPEVQHSNFLFHHFYAKLQGNIFKLNFDCCQCQQSNSRPYWFPKQPDETWSNTSKISLDFELKYSIITYRYEKTLHSFGSCTEKRPMDCMHFIAQFCKFCGINSRGCFILLHLSHAWHAWRIDFLIFSLILMIVDNPKGALWQSWNAQLTSKQQRKWKLEYICYQTN